MYPLVQALPDRRLFYAALQFFPPRATPSDRRGSDWHVGEVVDPAEVHLAAHYRADGADQCRPRP
jgi:hypothetical protein